MPLSGLCQIHRYLYLTVFNSGLFNKCVDTVLNLNKVYFVSTLLGVKYNKTLKASLYEI